MQATTSIERRYQRVFKQVAAFKQDGRYIAENGQVFPSILEQKDKLNGGFLINGIKGEVKEFSTELNKFPFNAALEVKRALLDEFYDIMVFLICLHQAHASHIDPLAALHSVNGAGGHSNSTEVLAEYVEDLERDLTGIPKIFAHMHSMSNHLPVPAGNLEGFERTVRKAWSNRRGKALSMYDPIEHVILTEEVAMRDKEPHVEFVLRALRKIAGRNLRKSDYDDPENWLDIHSWRNPAPVQRKLQEKLDAKKAPKKLPREINEITVYSHMPVQVAQL